MSHGDVSSRRPAAKLLNGAVSQRDRLSQAPAPDAVAVDGRSLPELLAFAARYGAIIRFYDVTDIATGDWSAFFASDPAVAAAMLGALDLPEIAAELRQLLAKARAADREARRHHVRRSQQVIVRLLAVLDAHLEDGDDVEIQRDRCGAQSG